MADESIASGWPIGLQVKSSYSVSYRMISVTEKHTGDKINSGLGILGTCSTSSELHALVLAHGDMIRGAVRQVHLPREAIDRCSVGEQNPLFA